MSDAPARHADKPPPRTLATAPVPTFGKPGAGSRNHGRRSAGTHGPGARNQGLGASPRFRSHVPKCRTPRRNTPEKRTHTPKEHHPFRHLGHARGLRGTGGEVRRAPTGPRHGSAGRVPARGSAAQMSDAPARHAGKTLPHAQGSPSAPTFGIRAAARGGTMERQAKPQECARLRYKSTDVLSEISR